MFSLLAEVGTKNYMNSSGRGDYLWRGLEEEECVACWQRRAGKIVSVNAMLQF